MMIYRDCDGEELVLEKTLEEWDVVVAHRRM